MDLNNLESLAFFYPEIVLTGTILLIALLDLVIENKKNLALVAVLGSFASLVATLELYGGSSGWLFHRMIVLDNFSLFFKVVSLIAVALVVWMSWDSKEVGSLNQGEYYTILLTSALAMILMAASSNLLMAYLSLELASLTSYILTGFLPHNRRSSEAALKYLIYGGVASGAMIYGMSWIYGMTGSLDYGRINEAFGQGQANNVALFIAFVLVLVGFGYKIVFVPFHMWSPDVYQGAPTPFTAFLSVGSNAAGVAMLIRFFFPGASRLADGGNWTATVAVEWPHALLFISMLTMTVGNLCALNQQNVKRLLAYSGIAHAGYVLMGLVVLSNDGLKAMLFYIVVYLVMNLGAFLVVMIVANATGREDLESYRGLAWRGAASLAACMAIFLFSLTGLPPLGGFAGKFFLFAAVIREGGEFFILALVAIVNSVISLYYYARIVKTMFLDAPEPNAPAVEVSPSSGTLLGVLTACTILFGVYFGPLLQYTNESLKFFIK
ncbi:MAG TPA: NADH-quinone oxidoreductase subunit N [Candidatus Acidoferrales bacterium]|nr:NADH-quinone oxidoreductase subunit N [Candidatus Acidoferrales bacterium]